MKKYNFNEIIKREDTNCVKYDMRKHFFGINDVMPMWVADMDFKTPDFIIDALKERLQHPVLGYSFFSDEYFHSIINWLNKKHDWMVQKDWISFSPGVVPGFSLLIQALTKPGDKIIIQPPVYHPFFSAIKDNDRVIIENELILKDMKYYMNFDDLKEKVKEGAKMLLLSNPHNPGGRVWTKNEMEELGNICYENNVLIVSDEIHSDLVFEKNKHIPLASINQNIAEITITCMAPSKTFNLAGLATSFLVISNSNLLEKYKEALNKLHIWYGNIFGVTALEAAYNKGFEWVNQLMKYIENNLQILVAFLEKNIPEIKAMMPEATYLVWLDCRALKMDDELLKKFFVEKAKVGLNSGVEYGKTGAGFMRMNIACPEIILKESLQRIYNAVKLN
ncbi:MAG: putative C-S lyase [Chlorobi bacterium]|nr:putative C-S lyase [Chlorobiota bacterium]